MLHQPEIVKELKTIAERYNLPYAVVFSVVESYFDQVAIQMAKADREAGYFPTIAIPYLGKFMVKKGRAKYLKEKANENKEANEVSQGTPTTES